MYRMILASGNAHKLEEIQAILKDFDIDLVSMADVGLKGYEIIEDGDTFEANAMIKAKAVMNKLGVDAIADDSGLMVDYLSGAPGIYSARYSGENATAESNNVKLKEALKDVPDSKRTARFVSVISVAFADGRELTVRGECEGVIGYAEKGNQGFGYDPLFIVPDKNLTFAELTSEEKNAISHRANALEKLKVELPKMMR